MAVIQITKLANILSSFHKKDVTQEKYRRRTEKFDCQPFHTMQHGTRNRFSYYPGFVGEFVANERTRLYARNRNAFLQLQGQRVEKFL